MSGLRLSAGFQGMRVNRWWGWSCSKQGTSPSATIHQWLASAFFLPQMSHVNATSQTISDLIARTSNRRCHTLEHFHRYCDVSSISFMRFFLTEKPRRVLFPDCTYCENALLQNKGDEMRKKRANVSPV